MDWEAQVSALIHALHDDREGLRHFAVRRLVNLGAPVIPAVIGVLRDNKEYTQESAAIVLASIGGAAIPHLLEAMKHDDRRIRWGAAWVLASLGPEARQTIPEVRIPEAQAEPRQPPRAGSGVWSDAWLTKIREQLNAARGRNVMDLENVSAGAC